MERELAACGAVSRQLSTLPPLPNRLLPRRRHRRGPRVRTPLLPPIKAHKTPSAEQEKEHHQGQPKAWAGTRGRGDAEVTSLVLEVRKERYIDRERDEYERPREERAQARQERHFGVGRERERECYKDHDRCNGVNGESACPRRVDKHAGIVRVVVDAVGVARVCADLVDAVIVAVTPDTQPTLIQGVQARRTWALYRGAEIDAGDIEACEVGEADGGDEGEDERCGEEEDTWAAVRRMEGRQRGAEIII